MDIRGVTTIRKPKEDGAAPSGEYDKLKAAERIALHKAAIAEEEAKLKGERDGAMH
jgi:hypothetical protein